VNIFEWHFSKIPSFLTFSYHHACSIILVEAYSDKGHAPTREVRAEVARLGQVHSEGHHTRGMLDGKVLAGSTGRTDKVRWTRQR